MIDINVYVDFLDFFLLMREDLVLFLLKIVPFGEEKSILRINQFWRKLN